MSTTPDDVPEGVLQVQGVVQSRDGAPAVQFKIVHEGTTITWTQTPDAAREHAALVVEAAANAVYEASMVEWATQGSDLQGPDLTREQAFAMIGDLREYRRDKWGQKPPEDWREQPEGAHRAEKLKKLRPE